MKARTRIITLAALSLLSACQPPAPKAPPIDTQKIATDAQELRKNGDAAKALELLRGANDTTPNNPQLLQQLGYALIETEQPQEAVGVFDQLIALLPDKAVGYTGKAVAFDHTGNHRAAQDIYEQALRIEPDSVVIKNNLAMSLILNDQPAEAITLLKPLVDGGTDNMTVRRNLALAYGVNRQPAKAFAIDSKDMPESDAREALKSYKEFAKTHGITAHKNVKPQVGFGTTTDSDLKKAEQKPKKTSSQNPAPDDKNAP